MKLIFMMTCLVMASIGTRAQSNYFAGTNAGMSNTTGALNTFVGFHAGQSNTIANGNSFFGSNSGSLNTIGSSNTMVGFSSGSQNTTGRGNNLFGDSAGFLNKTGSHNSFYGFFAGFQNKTGSNNVAIGVGAGPTSANANQSNRLYIGGKPNSPVSIDGNDDPLIYGEFDNEFVKINGTFEVTAGLSNPSDINLKNNFKQININEVLEKVSEMEIQQWTYKDRTDEIHIGATAQDFYQAFGLGSGDRYISTIDADGIALAAIQALKEKNDTLHQEVDDLKLLVSELLEKLEK